MRDHEPTKQCYGFNKVSTLPYPSTKGEKKEKIRGISNFIYERNRQ